MFMQMPLPAPHGSASHSFTSKKDPRARRCQRDVGSHGRPRGLLPTRAHPRSSGAAGATGSPGCSGRSSPRGPGRTLRGHRCSGSVGTRLSLRAAARLGAEHRALTLCHVPRADLDAPFLMTRLPEPGPTMTSGPYTPKFQPRISYPFIPDNPEVTTQIAPVTPPP